MVAYRLTLDAGTFDFKPAPTGDLWWSVTDADGNEIFDARYWVGTGTYQLEVTRGR